MSDETNTLVLRLLRSIDAKIDRIADQLRELTDRVGGLEACYASLSRRVDRIDDRLDRIERRLELHDLPAG